MAMVMGMPSLKMENRNRSFVLTEQVLVFPVRLALTTAVSSFTATPPHHDRAVSNVFWYEKMHPPTMTGTLAPQMYTVSDDITSPFVVDY